MIYFFIKNILNIHKIQLKQHDLLTHTTMRCKAVDYCSKCDAEIYCIDEENGWVHYLPIEITNDDGETIEDFDTICQDCFDEEDSDA